MGDLMDTVENFLNEDGWQFQAMEGRDVIFAGLQGQHASYNLYFDVKEETEVLIIYLVMGQNVPEERRNEIARFVTRANYGLIIGNFELDLNDGEVRYKVSVDIEGGFLVSTMIKNMIGAAVTTMDRYFPGIMSVCYSGESAEAAIESIEGGG